MDTANRPLNRQAIALEEAEAKIRTIVKGEFFKRTPRREIDKKIVEIIRAAEKALTIPSLVHAARRSLLEFYTRQYDELNRSFSWQLTTLTAIMLLQGRTLTGREILPTEAQKARAVELLGRHGYEAESASDGLSPRMLGNAMNKYMRDYMRNNVYPALERLAGQTPKDPGDVTGRNTLRNRAEMEVRYQGHKDQIAAFRARGVKLVIASVHADCSERCAPYQGRVYSLDGTSGRTDDGREYVPLETATDVPYTTKAGRTYMNGLLGFNCRHYLIEYKSGYRFPKPNAEVERREYAITETQRRLERNVRLWRTKAIEYKDQAREKYLEARRKAIAANREYIEYSKKNNRAFYPSRTKII